MINDINSDLNELIEKFKIITEQSLIGIAIIQDSVYKYFNKRICEMSGYSEEEIKNWAPNEFKKIIHPEDRQFVIEQVRRKQTGDPDVVHQYQYRVITKSGEVRWREVFGKTINYQGHPANLAMTIDITDKVKAEQQLKESEEKFSKAFSTNYLSMSITSYEEGKFIEVNDAWLNSFGFIREEVIGKDAKEIAMWVNENDRNRILSILDEQGSVLNLENKYRSKTGETRYGLLSFIKIILNGKPFILTIQNDITLQKLTEQKLKKSKEKYQYAYNQAEFYKDLFIHDINNTLQSLFSSIQLIDIDLEGIRKKTNIKKLMDIMYRQIKRGINLISNVRKLSQLENHEISLKKVDAFEILNRSIKFLKNTFQERKIQIEIDTNVEKISVLGNELLRDVFENILINSVRYNNNEIVEIKIKTSQVEFANISYNKLEFIDNGIGIEDERKERVLTRVDLNSKTTYGMGLGLSLVKKIIDNYGGKIWIEDKVKGDYSKGTNVILLIQKVVANN